MLYRIILSLRHLAYDKGWKKVQKADVPTICVGNITVGGTGKTPHVELLLRLLDFRAVAVLSRGYKRKSRGFRIVEETDTARSVGDEPLQIARKFPSATVAVDKDRLHGCRELAAGHPELIVLDDAFQYRKLDASLKIVLVDYSRPVFEDRLLPWGRLRDLPSRILKADAVIVSKCPSELPDEEKERWRTKLRLKPEQPLFFTTLRYDHPQPVFPEGDPHYLYAQKVVLVSGIANDAPLRNHISDSYKIVRHLSFPDHHAFSRSDIRSIAAAAKQTPIACLMTTEKDAQRLRDVPSMPDVLRHRLFYWPIRAAFLSQEEESAFQDLLLSALD